MDAVVAPLGVCGNESISQPITAFNQAVEELLSDIRVATPRTSDFYVASTRQVTGGNATVYAVGQCLGNASQAICRNCLSTAYNNLYRCVPADEGRAINVGCFMRYSEIPFFQENQTINLIPFLGKGKPSFISVILRVSNYIIGPIILRENFIGWICVTGRSSKIRLIFGVSSSAGLFLLILAFFLWFRQWKKSEAVGEGNISQYLYHIINHFDVIFHRNLIYTYDSLSEPNECQIFILSY